jgi:CheY-like chemotaxis protein/two-component sensor histidine kinase
MGSAKGVADVIAENSPAALEAMREQLVVSERMAMAGRLAGGIAHEINNPLAVVLANLDFVAAQVSQLARENNKLVDLQEALRDARGAADRIRDIVRDLRLFSNSKGGAQAPVDLRRIVESSIRMAYSEVKHRARLVKEYGEVPDVLASESHLGQAVLSLLVHATMSIPEGAPAAHEIRISTYTSDSGQAVLTVRDDGPPADRAELDRDLGLAVCRRIAADLGGEVDIAPGVCSIILPPASGLPAAGSGPHAVQSGAKKRANVLIVDDEEAVCKVVARGLSRHHDVMSFTRAEDAVARLDAAALEGEPVDVLVCDLMMPEVSGIDLYRQIAKKSPELARRMVFLTGGAYTPAAREFLDRVANPRIEKPFELANLLAIIAGLVR